MASSSVSLLSDIAIKLDELQAIVSRLLPSDVPSCAPVTFTLCGLNSKLGKGSKVIWYSPPFYTHPRGYKMVVGVFHSSIYSSIPSGATNMDRGANVSIMDDKSSTSPLQESAASFVEVAIASSQLNIVDGLYANVFLVKGEFDDYLRFPLRLSLELHIMLKTTTDSRCISVSFDDTTPTRYTVPSDSGVCLDKDRDYLLLSDSEIDVYCVEDCLTFKVCNVNVQST